ncbi:DNA ligase [Motilimonas pumila]|uniref:DNA ligase n=1 Tax=Motilimonas pumila TaxID=2303987 RepID=A0A418YH60_9GAMM|nr:DNA ligase [Motilimonas pumila]RJG49441.1 DNA ligase [Motilimonas pumila]
MRPYTLLWSMLFLFTLSAHAAKPPTITLAKTYQGDEVLSDYFVSEKFDGVRAFWDGRRLITRGGHPIITPSWFTDGFPTQPLDGELWAGYGRFDQVSGLVRSHNAKTERWREVIFLVFDVHQYEMTFGERYQLMAKLLEASDNSYIRLVKQRAIATPKALTQHLDDVLAKGGEGLMLKKKDSLYQFGRSNSLLKVKRYQDAEATVVGHLSGKGKFQGLLGALLVTTPQGLQFKIGSGFSEQERKYPPPIGSRIQYKHYGLTPQGVPRFASYLRLRPKL